MMPNATSRTGAVLTLLAGMLAAAPAPAQTSDSLRGQAVAPSPTQLKRENLNKLMRQIPDVKFIDHRLEDVLTFITEITGADIEPYWNDDTRVDGLEKDTLITLSANRISALRLLEMVLDKAGDTNGAFASGNTWQMTEWGTVECGPKEAIAKRQRLEVYSIDDLLWQIPDYEEAPTIDLQSVLQSSQGGGGGQSPFQNDQQQQDLDRRPKDERAQDVIDIIESLVEPETWMSGGGTASIRYFQGSLLVRAPDFVHRQIGGYPWWPASQTTAGVVNGRRYVSIGVDTGISTVDNLENQPVTATVGGGGGGGGGDGPGGG
jgi:hypothetical protein